MLDETQNNSNSSETRIDPASEFSSHAKKRNYYEDWEKNSQSRFHTVGFISQGGAKSIYKVKDKICGRYIAMAMLSDFDPPEHVKNRFIYEARITAVLEHPNIVPVHEIGFNKSKNPYFTMKLIGGENLGVILKRLSEQDEDYELRYPLTYLLDIFIQACNAVAFAHSKSIIHLDLKPENIQVGDFGEVLVLDWGLAKLLGPQSDESLDLFNDMKGLTKTEKSDLKAMASILYDSSDYDATLDGAVKGSPGYMAPEQASGQNSKRDKRTDIYSLGAILYSILTNEKPIEGETVKEVLMKTATGDFTAPQQRTPYRHIPTALEAITRKAMAVEPDQRYQTVKEVIDDIAAYKNGYATSVEDAGLLQQISLLLKRRKTESMILIISMLIVIVFFIISFIKVNESRKIAQENLEKVKQQRYALRETVRRLRREQEERMKAEKLAREKVLAEKKAKELAEKERIEKEEVAKKAKRANQTVKKLEEEKQKVVKLIVTEKQKAERLQKEKEKVEKIVREKEISEKKAKEEAAKAVKIVQEAKLKEKKLVKEKALAEKIAQEKVISEKKAKEETAKAVKIVQEAKLKEQKLTREKELAEQKAKEQLEKATKIAQEAKLKEQRLSREKQIAEKKTQETVAKMSQQQQQMKQLQKAKENVEELAKKQKEKVAQVRKELSKLEQEKRTISKLAAKEFYEKALLLWDDNDFSQATGYIDNAISNDPSLLKAYELKGKLYLRELRFKDAIALFNKAKRQDIASILAPFANHSLDKLQPHQLVQITTQLLKKEYFKNSSFIVKYGLTHRHRFSATDQKKLVAAANTAVGTELRLLAIHGEDFNFELTCKNNQLSLEISGFISDISPLDSLPVGNLSIKTFSPLTDLSTLATLPLHHLTLEINSAGPNNLTFLKGKNLSYLSIESQTDIDSIKCLKGMPLRELHISNLRGLKDLKVLQEAPLVRLILNNSQFNSIQPLKRMKLRYLCIRNSKINDLKPLKGMPLEFLDLSESAVVSIDALNGMKLQTLLLGSSGVKNIQSLKGIPLLRLDLSNTPVSDISPLAGMPLKSLDLANCDELSDLAPLAQCGNLESLSIPAHIRDLSFLASLKKLKYLDTESIVDKEQTVSKFLESINKSKPK